MEGGRDTHKMNGLTKLFILSSFALPLQLAAVEVDGLAATVGTQSILRSDVVAEMRRAGADESRYNEIRNQLIERRLIVKAAADAKMTMQDWLVDNRIREIVDSSFGGDRNRLVATLGQQKLPYPEWRKRIKEDMVVGAMRWNIVDKNVTASPAEMRAEYKAHPERYQANGKVTVSVILLKPEDAGKKDTVLEAVKNTSFADAARTYSADSRAQDGGVWKDVNPEATFVPDICAALAKLKVGELSPWVELSGWNFLLRKEGESGSSARTFAEAYDDIEENVRQEQAKRLYRDWIERLKSETYIKIY